jgi:hypothetical protein
MVQAFIVTLGGLSALQKRANALALDPATRLVYNDQFQSAGQVPCAKGLIAICCSQTAHHVPLSCQVHLPTSRLLPCAVQHACLCC